MNDRLNKDHGALWEPTWGGLRPADGDYVAWHLGWVVAGLAGAALMLLVAGAISSHILLALSLMALPGLVGALWRPRPGGKLFLVAIWAVCAAGAIFVSGGLQGPLPVLLVAPVVACWAIGGSWRVGVALSLGAAIVCAFLGLIYPSLPQPIEPSRTCLSLIALIATAGGAGGALLASHRRTASNQVTLEAELAAFQTLMGELPELALAMDAHGRTEAVFGQPLAGLQLSALQGGLVEAAVPLERDAVQAAITEAIDVGFASVSFILAATGQTVAVSLQRTTAGGLAAILRPAAAPAALVARSDIQLADSAGAIDVSHQLSLAEAARLEAEADRDRAEANASARSRFLANMSHELRTPLNAIMGFSDMMRTKVFGELAPKYAEYADLIHESGGHLLDLINDVLDMSKLEADRYVLTRDVFDVREPLNAALRLMRLQADDAGVKLRAILPNEPLMVNADGRALKQMMLNLLSNAVKFTSKDGTVILTVRPLTEPPIATTEPGSPGMLEIIVADTGVGIAEHDLKRLGRPFEQAGDLDQRVQGTGLGLALVDAFAKLHGGTLVLESRLGEGTAATVRLPVLIALEEVQKPFDGGAVEPGLGAAEAVGANSMTAPPPVVERVGSIRAEPEPVTTEPPRLTLVHNAPLSANPRGVQPPPRLG